MPIKSKILEKKLRLRSLIFVRRQISRQELIKQSNLNERTVIRYTAELEKQQMITSETVSASRGRPGIIYCSRSENCLFLGMRLSTKAFYVAVCDINGFPVAVQGINFSEQQVPAERYAAIRQLIAPAMTQFGAKIPGKVALAYDVSLLNNPAVAQRIAGEFQRRYHCICETYYNDDLSFWHLARHSGVQGKMLGIVCGSRLYAVLIDQDRIVPLKPNVLAQMRHYQVLPESDLICSCGKAGCAEAELIYSGTIHRYNRYSRQPLPSIDSIHNYKHIFYRAQLGDPAAQQVIAENFRMIRQLILGFAHWEKFDYVGFLAGLYFKSAPEQVRQLTADSALKPVVMSGMSNTENVFLPALYILHCTLNYEASAD